MADPTPTPEQQQMIDYMRSPEGRAQSVVWRYDEGPETVRIQVEREVRAAEAAAETRGARRALTALPCRCVDADADYMAAGANPCDKHRALAELGEESG